MDIQLMPSIMLKLSDIEPNKDYRNGDAFIMNCQSCVVVYEARRRGLNVTALGHNPAINSPSYKLSNDCTLAIQGAKVRVVNPKMMGMIKLK